MQCHTFKKHYDESYTSRRNCSEQLLASYFKNCEIWNLTLQNFGTTKSFVKLNDGSDYKQIFAHSNILIVP